MDLSPTYKSRKCHVVGNYGTKSMRLEKQKKARQYATMKLMLSLRNLRFKKVIYAFFYLTFLERRMGGWWREIH